MITLKDITFSYSDGFAIEGLNIRIDKQEFITILGPNGSGKSTLLKLMSRFLIPESGIIEIQGKPLSSFTFKELASTISYVPQFSNTAFGYSVYEIVMMGRTPFLNFAGYEREQDRKTVEKILDKLELTHLKNKGINEVSGGEAQRAFIARALAQNGKIMLLDEPLAHLDIKHQIEILRLLEKLNREDNLTIVMVSHDINLPASFSSKILLLSSGKVHSFGEVSSVLTEGNIREVFNVNAKLLSDGDKLLINLLAK